MSVLMFSLTGGSQTTRTHGHKKGSNNRAYLKVKNGRRERIKKNYLLDMMLISQAMK